MADQKALKVLIVANKTWECEPLVNVILHRDVRPVELQNMARGMDPVEQHKFDDKGFQLDPETGARVPLPPDADDLPVRGFLPVRPRLSLSVLDGGGIAEIWCLEDWMRKKRKKKAGDVATVDASSSSSFEKFMFALPQIKKHAFNGDSPDIVIAFGTAGIPAQETFNGCVTVGTRVYIHDPWYDAPEGEIAEQTEKYGPLLRDEINKYLDRGIDTKGFKDTLFSKDLSADVRHAAEARFLKAPLHPADVPRILAGHGYASLGTINICNYDDYVWADEETLRIFERAVKQREIGSMETTHGLIRLFWENTPFLFVSGLTDRVPMFNAEVTPRKYSQNFVAAHNAGVFVAFLLPELTRLHQKQRL